MASLSNNSVLNVLDSKANELLIQLQNNPRVYEHCSRVSKFAVTIAAKMGLPTHSQEQIRVASLFHDLGKLYLPSDILIKKQLTFQDWELIKTHSQLGKEAMMESESLSQFITWVLYHHERYDGSGYPQGLKGLEIPLESRIIAAADSLDAMISHRPYREETFSFIKAVYEIKILSGIQFDPGVTETVDCICRNNLPSFLRCLL